MARTARCLNSSTFYLGVAAGSAIGSLALAVGGVAALGWIAALAQGIALVILQWPPRSLRQPVLQPGE